MLDLSGVYLWLMAIPLIIGVVGGAAGIIAWFRWHLGESTIRTLKENNAALSQSVGILKAQGEEREKLIGELKDQVRVLRELVLQTHSIDKLSDAMKERDASLRELMTQGFADIVSAVRERPLPPAERQRPPRRRAIPSTVALEVG